jgi:hypothetical protein
MAKPKYRIVAVSRYGDRELKYVFEERWLCFWWRPSKAEFVNPQQAEGELRAYVSRINRAVELKSKCGTVSTYDENGNTCK